MKVAILIAVHKYPQQVKRLIDAFQSTSFTFFIHIDKKTDIRDFQVLLSAQNIIFIKKRTNVQWAGISQAIATQNCLKEILEFDDFDNITFISGQDFPIKSPEYFLDFLVKNKNREFVSKVPFNLNDPWWQKNKTRILRYNLNNWKIPGKFKIQYLLNKITKERVLPESHTICGNSNWFSISRNCAIYVTEAFEREKKLLDFFYHVWGADEMIIPTILFNSPFKEKMSEPLTYVEWPLINNGHPEILTMKSISTIMNSEKIFARKFDMYVDNQIITQIEDQLTEYQYFNKYN